MSVTLRRLPHGVLAVVVLVGAGLVFLISGSSARADTTVGGGLVAPYGVAVDASGDVFVADVNNARVVEHAPAPASLTYPTVGQTNVNTATPFSWGDVPAGQGYQLWIGTSRGSGSLLKSGLLSATTSTYQVPTLPTGVPLWATLYTQVAGTWNNYQVVPFTVTTSRDTFTYPAAGQQNINTLTPFSWRPETNAQAYRLTIGTNPGGVDLVNSGILAANVTSYREPALPAGQTLYARVAWEINGSWSDYQDVSFTAGPNPVVFTDPTQGQTGVSGPTTFTWSTSPAATGYQLWVGTTRGSGNLLKSGLLKASTSSYALPALPAGQTLWARIYTGVASGWGNWQDISFTVAPNTVAPSVTDLHSVACGVLCLQWDWTGHSGDTDYLVTTTDETSGQVLGSLTGTDPGTHAEDANNGEVCGHTYQVAVVTVETGDTNSPPVTSDITLLACR